MRAAAEYLQVGLGLSGISAMGWDLQCRRTACRIYLFCAPQRMNVEIPPSAQIGRFYVRPLTRGGHTP
jgi:hypothetical protein